MLKSIMGCVYSHSRSNDGSSSGPNSSGPKMYHVLNTDKHGTVFTEGDMFLTKDDLIITHKGSSTFWPLRSLRRYGWDGHLFSFECGRRCPTGTGIYAFRCTQAEQLFNELQEAINKTTNQLPGAEPPLSGGLMMVNQGPLLQVTSASDGNSTFNNILKRGSTSGILSPTGVVSSPPPGTGSGPSYVNSVPNYINSPIYNGDSGGASGSTSGATVRPIPNQAIPPSGIRDNMNYAKLDDLVRYYVNINTNVPSSGATVASLGSATNNNHLDTSLGEDAIEKATLTQPGGPFTSSPSISPSHLTKTTASMFTTSTPTHVSTGATRFVFPDSGSERKGTHTIPPTTSQRAPPPPPLTLKPKKGHVQEVDGPDHCNYIQLDLETTSSTRDVNTTNTTSHFVQTAPATPISKTPKEPHSWSPIDGPMPGTPTSQSSANGIGSMGLNGPRLPYAMIDFDKTDALTSVVAQRKGQQSLS